MEEITAVVLASGLGTRLKPLIEQTAKPLIQIGGKFLIEYTLTNLHQAVYFKPRGVPLSQLGEVSLSLEGLEAIRLTDVGGLDQTAAAEKMGVSQSTFNRVLATARRKVGEALTTGQAIKLEGGDYEMLGLGKLFGSGGRGRMEGELAAGPGGVCVCPACSAEVPHQVGVPCVEAKCSECGRPMVRKGAD